MTVNEITIKIYITQETPLWAIRGELAHFIDSYLAQDENFLNFHKSKKIKGYVWDLPVPIEKGMKAYRGNSVYQFRIRTVDSALAAYFLSGIADHRTNVIKGLARTIRQIPPRPIEKVYSITPYVLRSAQGKGYWRDCMSFEEFETELQKSVVNQYEMYTGETLGRGFVLYDQIELQSKCAVKVPYKGISLLGDKLSMQVADNEKAQKTVYFALANGLSMGPRGLGFLGYRFV